MTYVWGTWSLASGGGHPWYHLGQTLRHLCVVPRPSPTVREQGVGMGWDGWSWRASHVASCGVELWGRLFQDSATFTSKWKHHGLVLRQMAKLRRSFLPVLWTRGSAFSFCTGLCKLCSWPCLSHSHSPISPSLPRCFLLKCVEGIKTTSCFPCFPPLPICLSALLGFFHWSDPFLVFDTQLCLTLCGPMGCSPLNSSVHGILQARILEWVAIPFSRGSSQHRDWTQVSCIAGRFFTIWAARETLIYS